MADSNSKIAWHRAQLKKNREALKALEVARFNGGHDKLGDTQKAAEVLQSEHGVSAEVIDPRTLRPLDLDTILESVKKTNRAVIVEEGWQFVGIGAQVVDILQSQAFDDLDAPIERVTQLNLNISYAANLEKAAEPNSEKIQAAVKKVLYRENA